MYAQDQMKINEYGAVQQHLEPEHLRDLQIPIPEDWNTVGSLINDMKQPVEVKNTYYDLKTQIENDLDSKLKELISVNSKNFETDTESGTE